MEQKVVNIKFALRMGASFSVHSINSDDNDLQLMSSFLKH